MDVLSFLLSAFCQLIRPLNFTDKWNRPPNFLIVDYYNKGDGSVFKVAAEMNGVEYKGSCCGGGSDDGENTENNREGEGESTAAKVVNTITCWFILGLVLTVSAVII